MLAGGAVICIHDIPVSSLIWHNVAGTCLVILNLCTVYDAGGERSGQPAHQPAMPTRTSDRTHAQGRSLVFFVPVLASYIFIAFPELCRREQWDSVG